MFIAITPKGFFRLKCQRSLTFDIYVLKSNRIPGFEKRYGDLLFQDMPARAYLLAITVRHSQNPLLLTLALRTLVLVNRHLTILGHLAC